MLNHIVEVVKPSGGPGGDHRVAHPRLPLARQGQPAEAEPAAERLDAEELAIGRRTWCGLHRP